MREKKEKATNKYNSCNILNGYIIYNGDVYDKEIHYSRNVEFFPIK